MTDTGHAWGAAAAPGRAPRPALARRCRSGVPGSTCQAVAPSKPEVFKQRVDEKNQKYYDFHHRQGIVFVPL
eukprot:3112690-Rhodomonas_salina.3